MICGMKHFVLHIQGCGGAGVPALSYKKVNQTTKRAWNVRVVWRNCFFIFGLSDYVFLENGSCPLKTGPCHVLVFKRALGVGWWQHQICIHQKFRPNVQKKKWMKRLWLKIVHVVSCQMVENVEIGWHATLLTNGWSMDMVKMSVLDKSLKCWNYPPKKKHVLPFVGPRQSSTHKCVRKIVANRWRPPNSANCWKC